MTITVREAAAALEELGTLRRTREDHSAKIVDRVRELLGRELPPDLEEFYRERIARIGDFDAVFPHWNAQVGWRPMATEVTELAQVSAVPLFNDGCGNLFGLDLLSGNSVPAVYFFDHEVGFEKPEYAAGSALGPFLLLLAQHDQAIQEGRAPGWELTVDPDIDKCPRAPPIWLAD
ncbi:MAG: SMI1/KNR4 family protein [Pseudomonadota bacterium]